MNFAPLVRRRFSKLRPVIALDNDDIGLGFTFTNLLGGAIVRRMIASKRRLVAWKFQHHDPAASFALHDFLTAAAHQVARAEFAERGLIGDHIRLVTFRVPYIDL